MTSAPEMTGAAADAAMDAELRARVAPLQRRAEEALESEAARWTGPDPLPEAMRYAILGGGKRLRPVMVYAAADACGGAGGAADAAAVALEMVHGYSLVHDDLPAMDDDAERRGMPTVHVRYGVANAILVGDALLTEAFGVLARAHGAHDEQRVHMVGVLARAAGSNGMVGGQVEDIGMTATTAEELLAMHAGKTGALFVAACELGALAAGASPDRVARLTRFGGAFGEAFQIGDDMVDALDLDDTDEHEARVNLAAVLGMSEARVRVAAAADRARSALETLPGEVSVLRTLVDWTDHRAADALRRAGT